MFNESEVHDIGIKMRLKTRFRHFVPSRICSLLRWCLYGMGFSKIKYYRTFLHNFAVFVIWEYKALQRPEQEGRSETTAGFQIPPPTPPPETNKKENWDYSEIVYEQQWHENVQFNTSLQYWSMKITLKKWVDPWSLSLLLVVVIVVDHMLWYVDTFSSELRWGTDLLVSTY